MLKDCALIEQENGLKLRKFMLSGFAWVFFESKPNEMFERTWENTPWAHHYPNHAT